MGLHTHILLFQTASGQLTGNANTGNVVCSHYTNVNVDIMQILKIQINDTGVKKKEKQSIIRKRIFKVHPQSHMNRAASLS